MRLLFLIALAATASAGPAATVQQFNPRTAALTPSDCPDTAGHLAGQGSTWRDGPVTPQKLGELPPADAFAAVYKTDERGCMVPVRYRDRPGR